MKYRSLEESSARGNDRNLQTHGAEEVQYNSELSITDQGREMDPLQSLVNNSKPKSLQLIDKLINDLEKSLGHPVTSYDDELISGEDEDILELLQIKGDHTAPCNPEEEKAKTLEKITTAYEKGKSLWDLDPEAAALEFVEALKPVLSKPKMQNLYVNIDDCKKILLDSMYHLGKLYLASEKYTEHHAKAAAIFQYCAKFAKKYEVGNHADLLRQAYEVETQFLASIDKGLAHKGNSTSIQEAQEHKNELEQIREVVKQRLAAIKDLTITQIEQRAKEVELIYQDCTSFFVNNNQDKTTNPGLVQKLLTSCFQQLGQPPKDCHYSIIGLGSLASGRMTPWSDLEFAVLINEDKEEYKEYFRNLTKLLHIKVINLGETPLRSAGVESLNNFRTTDKSEDWFWDELSTNGFSFDGPDWHACKFPLGRQGGYQAVTKTKLKDGTEREVVNYKPNYELILTPKDLARFQSEQSQDDNKESWFKSDPHLVEALRLVSLIDGRQDLLDAYRQEMGEAVDVAIVRARALGELQQDVSKFSLKVGDGEEGKLLDVKKDIFRIGDRVINDLADYYDIMAEKGQPGLTVWQIIDKMEHRKILSSEGAKHLKEAISIATELRLSTYSHNKGQKEGMSTYEPATEHLSEKQKKILLEETFYIKDTSILHHFYYVVLPLQNIATALCDESRYDSAQKILELEDLFYESNYTKGMVHARFLEYDRALIYMEEAREQEPENIHILQDLSLLYFGIKATEKALQTAQIALKIVQNKHLNDPNHSEIAASYTDLGNPYFFKGEYEEAIKCHKLALEIMRKAYEHSPNHPDIASIYTNLGIAHHSKGEYEEAIKYHKLALKIGLKAYEHSSNHSDIAIGCNNLGAVYDSKGEYEKAIKCHKLALEIRLKAYKHSPNHPKIATSYNNLGNAYDSKGEYGEAIKCYKLALEIRLKAYEHSPNHPDIADSYNNLGAAYRSKGEYEEAIKYHKLALDIQRKAYEHSPNHPKIAGSYTNLGSVHCSKGEYEEAIKYHKLALDIQRKAYEHNRNHPKIAGSYTNLGSAHCSKEEYDEAIKYHKLALDIQRKAYEHNRNHPDIASSYNNLGAAYYSKEEYDKAIKYHEWALEIRLKAYKHSPNHPDIADSYDNLGRVYYSKGEYEEAIKYHKLALEIMLEAYKHSPNHPKIASSYNCLGSGYYSKGEYKEAIKYHQMALEIRLKAYEHSPNHPDIAASYDNLGRVYYSKGEYEEAIKYHKLALEIRLKAYKHSPNHPEIASSYNCLGSGYYSKGEYKEAIKYYQISLNIMRKAYEHSPNHSDIVTGYTNLSSAYYVEGDYQQALTCVEEALKIFSPHKHKQIFMMASTNRKNSLVQLGNEALLKGATDKAREYYAQIDPKYKHIDLNSPDFIELHLQSRNTAYKSRALDASINSQLVLLKLDPKLDHGNHYHNLACFYNVKGDIKQANEVFIKALSHKVSSALHVEYAQFLLLNANYLNPSPQTISNHLYAAIANDDSSLEYGLLEKDTISNILKNIIEENRQFVSITPRVLAYYLLVKHPQYLADNDNVGNALQILREIYENSQNHISLKLLADAYESNGYKVLVAEQNAAPAADSPPEPPLVPNFSQQDEVPISGAAADNQ